MEHGTTSDGKLLCCAFPRAQEVAKCVGALGKKFRFGLQPNVAEFFLRLSILQQMGEDGNVAYTLQAEVARQDGRDNYRERMDTMGRGHKTRDDSSLALDWLTIRRAAPRTLHRRILPAAQSRVGYLLLQRCCPTDHQTNNNRSKTRLHILGLSLTSPFSNFSPH
jgi:hypothetical protein